MTLLNPLEQGSNFAVLALNNHLPSYFTKIWHSANLRICTEGGANKVSEYFMKNGEKDFPSPDAVVGNSNTIDKKIRKHFESSGCQFVKEDGDEVTKALSLLEQMNYKDPIFVLSDFDGLFDKFAHIINITLPFEKLRVIISDDNNFTSWYRPTDKEILTPMKCTTNMCGLIPLIGPTKMKTEGLKWNVDGELEMGIFISSSNEIAAPIIKIETELPFLWTVQAKHPLVINQ